MKALKLIINGEEHKLPKGVTSVNGKSGNVVLTTSDIPVLSNNYQYISSADKTKWDNKQDTLTAGEGISIANEVISNTGVLTVNGEDGDVVVNDVKKKATSPSSPTQGTVWYDTTNDILKTYDGTDWNEVGAGTGDMLYEDFEFATKTGNAITLSISSKVTNPSADFTINAPSEIKDGITYVLRVENGATPPAMTLGTNITNPYNVDLSLSASKTDTFAFLAVDNKLELQPTEADISDNVYTKTEVDALLDDKQDKLTTGSGISITNKVISNTGVLTVNGDSGTVVVNDVKKSATAPANPTEGMVWYDTTNDVLKVYDGTDWNEVGAGTGDIKYEDFEFVTMTGTVIENLSATKSISADTTLTAGASLKEGMQYLVRVTNTDTAPHNITFGGDSIEVGANETKSFVFLATSSSTLELQVCEGGGGGQTITIDSALSTTSTNPVQNKVITEKIDELELGVVVHSSTAPASASEGMLWYDTTNKILKIYNGTSWENVGNNGDYIEVLSGSPVVKKYEWIGTEAQFLALGSYRADTEYKIY